MRIRITRRGQGYRPLIICILVGLVLIWIGGYRVLKNIPGDWVLVQGGAFFVAIGALMLALRRWIQRSVSQARGVGGPAGTPRSAFYEEPAPLPSRGYIEGGPVWEHIGERGRARLALRRKVGKWVGISSGLLLLVSVALMMLQNSFVTPFLLPRGPLVPDFYLVVLVSISMLLLTGGMALYSTKRSGSPPTEPLRPGQG